MDIIIVGKASHNRNDAPMIIYCGQDRGAAAAAVSATSGKYPRIYEVNPEPFRPLAAPVMAAPVTIPPKPPQEQEQGQAVQQEATEGTEAEAKARRPSKKAAAIT
jgi:hypothetical protein